MTTPPTPDLLATLESNSRFLRALTRSLVSDASVADDLVQETWLAALDRPPPRAVHLRGWLATVARNLAWRALRGRDRRVRRERVAASPDLLPPTDELVMRGEIQRNLVNSVMELSEPFRSTVLLRYFEGLTSAEIARRAGEPESTVRARLKHALDQLRSRLDAETDGGREAWLRALLLAAPPATTTTLVPALVVSCALLLAIAATTWWWTVRRVSSQAPLAAAFKTPGPATAMASDGTAPLEPRRDPVTASATPAANDSEDTHDPADVSRVVGVIVAADGRRPAGIDLVVTPDGPESAPITGRSGAYGRFELRGVPIATPAHLVGVSPDGRACARAVFEPHAGFTDVGELLLAERVSLHGSVVDLGGSPIALARVRCETWSLDAQCDASGRFTFDAIPAGRCEIALDALGFVLTDSNVLDLQGTECELTLHAVKGVVVEGRVVDPDGRPIAGARVDASTAMRNRRQELVADGDGLFRTTLPAAQRWCVSAVAPGYTLVGHEVASEERSIEIVLQPTHLWCVEVIDPQAAERDTPLSVSIYYLQASDLHDCRRFRLSDDGRQRVPGSDPSIRSVARDRFELRVNGTLDFCVGVKSRGWVEQWSPPIHFDALSPPVTESRFKLERRTGALECAVVDAEGAPVGGARVALDDEIAPPGSTYSDWTDRWLHPARDAGHGPPPLAELVTNEAGVATLRGLAAKRYRLTAMAPDGLVSAPIEFKIVEGTGVVRRRIVLSRGGAIEGHVTDESKRPVGAIEVWAVSSNGDRRVTHSATDGSFRFDGLDSGAWDVRAHRDREPEWYRTANAIIVLNENLGFDIKDANPHAAPPPDHVATTVEVIEGGVAHAELLARPRSGATIEGLVRDDDGALAGIFVEGWTLEEREHASGRVRNLRTVTDATGHFRFENVASGRWRIAARGRLGVDGRVVGEAELFGSFVDCWAAEIAPAVEVSVEASSPTPITLLAHLEHLRGEVVDAVSGEPVADAELSIAGAPGIVRSDARGRFETVALSACEHRCEIHVRGYTPTRVAPLADAADVRLALRPGGWVRVRPTAATHELAIARDLHVQETFGAKGGARMTYGGGGGNPPRARDADGTTWFEVGDADCFTKYAVANGRLPATLVFRSETAEPHEVPLEVEFSDSKVNEFTLE